MSLTALSISVRMLCCHQFVREPCVTHAASACQCCKFNLLICVTRPHGEFPPTTSGPHNQDPASLQLGLPASPSSPFTFVLSLPRLSLPNLSSHMRTCPNQAQSHAAPGTSAQKAAGGRILLNLPLYMHASVSLPCKVAVHWHRCSTKSAHSCCWSDYFAPTWLMLMLPSQLRGSSDPTSRE